MAHCRIVFLTLVLSVVQIFGSQVPVFLWGNLPKTSLKANPLSTVDAEEFGHIVTEELKTDPFTVVFIEETLSVEDFSRKDAEGKTLFPYLRSQLSDSYYIPSVQDALRVLNQVGESEVDHVKLTDNGLSADIDTTHGKFLFINMKDAREEESRADMLKRHNDFIKEVFSKLQDRYASVIGIYTAHYPSWIVTDTHSRVKRQAEVTSTSNSTAYVFDGLRLYSKSIGYSIGSTKGTLTDLTSGSSTYNATAGTQSSTLAFNDGVTLVLTFIRSSGYWYFESIDITKDANTQTLLPVSAVYAPTGYSYGCSVYVNFTANNDTTHSVNFVNLQVQPFFENRNVTDLVFEEIFDCIGYFDTTILACLMISFLLLAILFYGIMNMMDIRTMDRFDDPKGKTITINPTD